MILPLHKQKHQQEN